MSKTYTAKNLERDIRIQLERKLESKKDEILKRAVQEFQNEVQRQLAGIVVDVRDFYDTQKDGREVVISLRVPSDEEDV